MSDERRLKARTRKARLALVKAIHDLALMRGSAEFCDGRRLHRDTEDAFQESLRRWNHVGEREALVDSRLTAYTRAVRAEAKAGER